MSSHGVIHELSIDLEQVLTKPDLYTIRSHKHHFTNPNLLYEKTNGLPISVTVTAVCLAGIVERTLGCQVLRRALPMKSWSCVLLGIVTTVQFGQVSSFVTLPPAPAAALRSPLAARSPPHAQYLCLSDGGIQVARKFFQCPLLLFDRRNPSRFWAPL